MKSLKSHEDAGAAVAMVAAVGVRIMDDASKFPREVYRFDHFSLDLGAGALLGADGVEIRLRPKSFALLRLLVENADRLLDRDTIMASVWPGVIVTDESIAQCVKEVRRALGDEAQRLVKTVTKRGYMLTGKVLPSIAVAGGKPSIAVLPFVNMSSDPEQEYFSDGIADDIITELSRDHSLFVIARNSSFSYKGRSVDMTQIAHDLGVRCVLEGSVRRSGDQIRVNAQLIDAETGNHIWAERYDRAVEAVFTVQDEITSAVVRAILPVVADAERQRAMRKAPDNLSAWEAWQRALWHWSKGGNLSTTRVFLQLAVSLDPRFAAAHAMMAWLCIMETTLGTAASARDSVALARAEARNAIELDPDSAVAHAALAWVYHHQGDRDAALEEAETAIMLNPNDPRGYLSKGHSLVFSGRPAGAREPLATALRLDPRGPTTPSAMHHRAVGCYFERDYQESEALAGRAIRAYPENPRPYPWLAAALGQLGHTDEAQSALSSAIAASTTHFKFITDSRPPYVRPDDHEHLLDGLRKAGWQG